MVGIDMSKYTVGFKGFEKMLALSVSESPQIKLIRWSLKVFTYQSTVGDKALPTKYY